MRLNNHSIYKVVGLLILMLSNVNWTQAQQFKKMNSGLEYHFLKKKLSFYKAKPGDIATMHIHFKISDSSIIDSKSMNGEVAIDQPLSKPTYKGDVFEGILKMKKGSIAIFRLPVKQFYRNTEQQIPEWVDSNAYATWHVEMVDVKSEKKTKKVAAAKAKKQLKRDEAIIEKDLIAKGKTIHLLHPNTVLTEDTNIVYKDKSGLYFIVQKNGSGVHGVDNKKVSLNYTGSLMDGSVFDSNTDPKFNHVQPISFTVGKGQMIKGWDKMLPLMRVGQKVKAIMASGLAYGPQARSPAIPANGILIFDMELLEVE